MANAVSGATSDAVIAHVQSTQTTQVPKIASNSAAPEDKVTISQAGRAAQEASQPQHNSETDHDGARRRNSPRRWRGVAPAKGKSEQQIPLSVAVPGTALGIQDEGGTRYVCGSPSLVYNSSDGI